MIAVLTPTFNRLHATLIRRRTPPAPTAPDAPCPLAHPDQPLPPWVTADPVAQKYRALLGDLPWAQFPERPTDRPWPGPHPAPRAPFVAAGRMRLVLLAATLLSCSIDCSSEVGYHRPQPPGRYRQVRTM
jgi:hypothetical protein